MSTPVKIILNPYQRVFSAPLTNTKSCTNMMAAPQAFNTYREVGELPLPKDDGYGYSIVGTYHNNSTAAYGNSYAGSYNLIARINHEQQLEMYWVDVNQIGVWFATYGENVSLFGNSFIRATDRKQYRVASKEESDAYFFDYEGKWKRLAQPRLMAFWSFSGFDWVGGESRVVAGCPYDLWGAWEGNVLYLHLHTMEDAVYRASYAGQNPELFIPESIQAYYNLNATGALTIGLPKVKTIMQNNGSFTQVESYHLILDRGRSQRRQQQGDIRGPLFIWSNFGVYRTNEIPYCRYNEGDTVDDAFTFDIVGEDEMVRFGITAVLPYAYNRYDGSGVETNIKRASYLRVSSQGVGMFCVGSTGPIDPF